ncbi:MAG: NADAR family protein [Minisyncoccia bacterium]
MSFLSREIAMLTQRFHLAAKAIESDGVGGFRKASEMVGAEAAFALVVAFLRRGFGSMDTWPAMPEIDSKVDTRLAADLEMVYKVLSQQVALFYTGRWYCFDNFSAFTVEWCGRIYPTAEHLYQARKYIDANGVHIQTGGDSDITELIRAAPSAHEAKKLGNAFEYQDYVRKDWDDAVKFEVMEEIVRAKSAQHEYVRKKLAESKGLLLVEDSHRDPFWGRGPDWDGQNHLGRIWTKVRDEP